RELGNGPEHTGQLGALRSDELSREVSRMGRVASVTRPTPGPLPGIRARRRVEMATVMVRPPGIGQQLARRLRGARKRQPERPGEDRGTATTVDAARGSVLRRDEAQPSLVS